MKRAGPRIECANFPLDQFRRFRPIDLAILARKFWSVGGGGGVLRNTRRGARHRSRSASRRASGASCARRSCNDPPVSLGKISSLACNKMSPVSRPSSTYITVMPVSLSPADDRSLNRGRAAMPGRSEACKLRQAIRGISRTALGKICPYAITTMTSGCHARICVTASDDLMRAGCEMGTAVSTNASLIAGAVNLLGATGRLIRLRNYTDEFVLS